MRRYTQHPVVRNALALYGIQAANYLLPLITFPYLAHVLNPAYFGLIGSSQAFVQYFLTFTDYGFNLSATQDVAVHRNDPAKLSRIYSAVMAAKSLLMVVGLVMMSAIIFVVPKLRHDWPIFYISFLAVLGSVLFPVWLFQGLEKMEYITIREVGARIFGLMTIFFFVRKESDYLIAAAIQSGSSAVAGLVGLMYVRKFTGLGFSRISWKDITETLGSGWHIFISTAAITLYTSSNTFILYLVATPASVGFYIAAQRIIMAAKSLFTPLSTAIFPHISHLASSSREDAVVFIRKNLKRLTLPFLLMSVCLIVGAPIVIPIVFGPKYGEAIRLLQVMGPIPYVVALGTSFATYFMLGLGYRREWSRMIMQAGAINFVLLLPLLYLLAPALAVAVTGTLVEVFVLARSYVFYRKHQ